MEFLELPNEVLSRIISFLDTPSPFDDNLLQKPVLERPKDEFQMQFSETEPRRTALKSLSSLSRLLRSLTLPFLFKHVILDPVSLSDFITFLGQNDLQQRVSSIVAVVSGHYNHVHPAWWARLLNEVPTTRLSIIAAPHILAELTAVSAWSTDAWAFDIPYQILCFDQSPESTRDKIDYEDLPNFLDARPWTSLTVNEGSSVLAYTTYEYFFRRTPSLLSALSPSGSTSGDSLFASLTAFQYVAIFPFYNHVDEVLKCIQKMTRLQKLSLKLCPDAGSTILHDEIIAAGSHLDINDPWNECETSWRLIAHHVAALTSVGVLRELHMKDVQIEGVRESLEFTLNRILKGYWTYSGERTGLWLRNPDQLPPKGPLTT
ncbi:uncharacterized protein A1O9_06356 [Exophiala aquamarina CBS 119918]|uniref:F-box domain-containing protein n=1 Tax=Exophiala aquamarina CBS 119918 TaxID=1182545 RepID=A0A072PSD6_9EURO|nr:uncharacterized protein A1O9_06356 [Exophiala aquamarina CBS 119918]KEF58430.1 hypothetical protein A1O9_06356 [Exophiala aquamarina CBS 119918]